MGQEDPLEKEIATHSHILACGKSHGQRSLAGYSPWGPKRVGYDLATKTTVKLNSIIRVNLTSVTDVLILRRNSNTEAQMERRQRR